MVCQLFEGFFVSNFVSLFYVSFENIVDKVFDIGTFVLYVQQFGKASFVQVFVEGCTAEGFRLGGFSVFVNLFHIAIFREGERVEVYLFRTSRQVGGKFTAEQFRIRTGNDDVHFLSQHAIDEKMPTLYVLYLVKKQVVEIPVYLVEYFEYVIEPFCLQIL